MHVNVAKEVVALEAMTVNELRAKYAQVFGEETRVGNKAWLVKRIIWSPAGAPGPLGDGAARHHVPQFFAEIDGFLDAE